MTQVVVIFSSEDVILVSGRNILSLISVLTLWILLINTTIGISFVPDLVFVKLLQARLRKGIRAGK